MSRVMPQACVPHDVPRQPQLPRDRLDLPPLHEVGASHPSDRIHRDHPPLGLSRDSRTSGQCDDRDGGQFCTPAHSYTNFLPNTPDMDDPIWAMVYEDAMRQSKEAQTRHEAKLAEKKARRKKVR